MEMAKTVRDLEYGALAQFVRLRRQPADVPADLAADIKRIETRLAELKACGP
jgi:hypothetical protein